MTIRDLEEALARIKDDPRVHPSTRIELAYEAEYSEYNEESGRVDTWHDEQTSDLLAIVLADHTLVLSTRNHPNALAR